MAESWIGIQQPGQLWQATQHFWTFGNMAARIIFQQDKGIIQHWSVPLTTYPDQVNVEMTW